MTEQAIWRLTREGEGPVTGSEVQFISPNLIQHRAGGFAEIAAGDVVRVNGSALNDRAFYVLKAGPDGLSVLPPVVVDEPAGGGAAAEKL